MKLLSDGESLILSNSAGPYLITMEKFMVVSTDISANRRVREVSFDYGGTRNFSEGPMHVELDLKIISNGSVVFEEGKELSDLELGRDLFKHFSITELLDAVNRKLNDMKRGDK